MKVFVVILVLAVGSSSGRSLRSRRQTACRTTEIDEIFADYSKFTIHDLQPKLVDQFLCDKSYPLKYVNCYLNDECGEDTAAFRHIRDEIVNNLASTSGTCSTCSKRTQNQIRKIVRFVQKLPEWRLVLRKVQTELDYAF